MIKRRPHQSSTINHHSFETVCWTNLILKDFLTDSFFLMCWTLARIEGPIFYDGDGLPKITAQKLSPLTMPSLI